MANRGPVFLGFPNYIAENYCTVATTGFVGLEPTDMVASYIKTDEPSDISRLTLLDPRHTMWIFNFSGIVGTFQGFSIINHNLKEGSSFRMVGYLSAVSGFVYETQAPNVIASNVNATGVITNIDEVIDTPDGLVVTPTATASDWSVRLSWGVLSPLPRAGTEGFFVLRMQRLFSGAGATDPLTLPKVTVSLYESGVLKRELGYRPVTETSAGGQVLIFPFLFSELTDPNGSNIECFVSVTGGTSTSGFQYAVLESLRLYFEGPLVIPQIDSGWIDVTGKDEHSPTASDHYFPETSWEDIKSVVLLIRSDQVEHDAPVNPTNSSIPYLTVSSDPFSYVEIGVFCAGGAEFLEKAIGVGKGPLSKVVVTGAESGSTIGGQSYSSDLFRRRTVSPISMMVNRDELLFLQKEVAWKKGKASPFYISLQPDIDKEYQQFISFWATLSELGEPVEMIGNVPGREMMFTVSVGLEEKL